MPHLALPRCAPHGNAPSQSEIPALPSRTKPRHAPPCQTSPGQTEPGHATLVTWRSDAPTETVARAYEAGVIIRELLALNWLRASVGWWNDEDDLERLVAAVT